jgi:hypothetical protein
MRYRKPSLAVLATASLAIQLIGDKGMNQQDTDVPARPALSTGGAYDLYE